MVICLSQIIKGDKDMLDNVKKVCDIVLNIDFFKRCALGEKIANTMVGLSRLVQGVNEVTIMNTIVAAMYIDGFPSAKSMKYVSAVLQMPLDSCEQLINHFELSIARNNPEEIFELITSRSKNTPCNQDGIGEMFLMLILLVFASDDVINEKKLITLNKYFFKFFTDEDIEGTISYTRRVMLV